MGSKAGIAWDGPRVLNASIDAMAIVDGEEYVLANEAYADLYGFARPDDLAGEVWERCLANEDRERFREEILPTVRTEGQWRGTVTGRRQDGRTFTQILSVGLLDDEQFICLSREIDSEEQHGSANEDHCQLLRSAIDAIDDIVYVLDEDGDAVLWNAKLREVTGYTDSEIDAMDPKELIAPEQHEYVPGLAETIDQLGEQHVDLDLVTKDGKRIPHEFRGTTFEDPEAGHVYRCGIARNITNRKEREQELRAQRQFNKELVENAPFGMFRLDEDLRITYENPRAEEIIGLPEEQSQSAAIGTDIRELPPIIETGKADIFTRLQDGETIEFEFPFNSIYDKEAYFTGRGVPLYRDGEFAGAILMAIDISARRQHEQELERQRDELETIARINELLLEITRNLFESPTRNEIEQTVCNRLASSELYKFAWIGAPDTEENQIIPRNSAGIDDGYIESATITTTETEKGQGPGGRAYRTGKLQVSQDIRSDPTFEPWREEALDRGIKAAAAVPLVHGDTTYGILAVYATRPLAFSRREQAGFETLSKAVGFAINAIENRKLLFADTVVELEFEVTDSDMVFVRASEQLGCELTIADYVEKASGAWTMYLSVEGADPTAVQTIGADAPAIEQAQVVSAEDESGLVEFVMDGPVLNQLTEHGGVLTAGHVVDGQGRFCIEVPQTADIRHLASQFKATYSDSTLVAQREFDRPVQKACEMRQSIDDDLTKRQQESLTRAYYAGYFDWPRQCTAGDVAESIGISETTFHYHLRNALDTLSAAFISREQG